MSIGNICNIAGWVLCAVVAFLLLSDFIKTERAISKEAKNKQQRGLDE